MLVGRNGKHRYLSGIISQYRPICIYAVFRFGFGVTSAACPLRVPPIYTRYTVGAYASLVAGGLARTLRR